MVLAVVVTYRILVAALVVRVIAAWFGYFRYTRWIRPAYALTDWLVEPIRRVLPIAGGVDWSPLAAWLVLVVLKWRSEEHTSELQSQSNLVCRLLLEKKKKSTEMMCSV